MTGHFTKRTLDEGAVERSGWMFTAVLPLLLSTALHTGCYRSHARGAPHEPIEEHVDAELGDARAPLPGDSGLDAQAPRRPDASVVARPPPPPDASLDAGAPPDASADAGPPPPDASADAGPPPPLPPGCVDGELVAPPGDDSCELTLRFLTVEPDRATCFIDENVSGRTATLRFECAGGAAELVVEGRRFAGEVRGDRLELCLATRFEWVDGCTWISSQQIYGDLATGALAFAYREVVEDGGWCASACSGTGRVLIE
jgi:hypothetical protein